MVKSVPFSVFTPKILLPHSKSPPEDASSHEGRGMGPQPERPAPRAGRGDVARRASREARVTSWVTLERSHLWAEFLSPAFHPPLKTNEKIPEPESKPGDMSELCRKSFLQISNRKNRFLLTNKCQPGLSFPPSLVNAYQKTTRQKHQS